MERPLNGRGLGHMISNFLTPNNTLITFERIELSASDLVQIWRTDPRLYRQRAVFDPVIICLSAFFHSILCYGLQEMDS